MSKIVSGVITCEELEWQLFSKAKLEARRLRVSHLRVDVTCKPEPYGWKGPLVCMLERQLYQNGWLQSLIEDDEDDWFSP